MDFAGGGTGRSRLVDCAMTVVYGDVTEVGRARGEGLMSQGLRFLELAIALGTVLVE